MAVVGLFQGLAKPWSSAQLVGFHSSSQTSPPTKEEGQFFPRFQKVSFVFEANDWEGKLGYPGRILRIPPEDIDTDIYRYDELIGPLSSLFWLSGLDELVETVFDPAITLNDEVRLIPTNDMYTGSYQVEST
ncbi:hypothetical protein PENFLA_c020G05225 [Penicillium flavigenum]|uniref:Uncharacterized protein n=1 Tax=Penicillium flavigenum TaxID=254877 RepID=A0A1V6SXZ8_9EURO|nr:hypothetical protein PENFLA_c020G05225 [Penicillium flavigenum]